MEKETLLEYAPSRKVIYEDNEGFFIEQEKTDNGYLYFFYSPFPQSELISFKRLSDDYGNIPYQDFYHTDLYGFFVDAIEEFKEQDMYPEDMPSASKDSNFSSFSYPNSFYKYYEPVKPKSNPEKVAALSKSDTLVFHKKDPTTESLGQVYEGRGWDLIREPLSNFSEEDVEALFNNHDRLVFLGHGSSYGLMGMFGPEVAKYMKDKKIFAIWCNADKYFQKAGIGDGQFITGNMPSEVWECRAAGCGKISPELMDENITYWGKLCGDVSEACLEGRVKESVDYIRKNYLEKYGNHPVTIYNAERTQALNQPQPLPAYTFKGKKLEEKDYPYIDFNEEEFLKEHQ